MNKYNVNDFELERQQWIMLKTIYEERLFHIKLRIQELDKLVKE